MLFGIDLPTDPDAIQSLCALQLRHKENFEVAQSACEQGREIGVADVIEAIELQAAGAYDLKTSVAASGFVCLPAAAEASPTEGRTLPTSGRLKP